MAKAIKGGKKASLVKGKARHLVEELEEQFHHVQHRLGKARADYVANHKKELDGAREKLNSVQKQLTKARTKAAKAAVDARKAGTKAARNQLKKARAASLLLAESLKEAKGILVTAQSNLHAAKPFDRKLAARAKVLAQFEKDWEKKIQAESAAKTAKAKKAAAKRRSKARKRAAGSKATLQLEKKTA